MDIKKMSREEMKKFMNQEVEPIKIFDDVWYIGRRGVGVFAITTDEGIVLIDAMDPVDAADKYIVPGLKKVGLDPANINTIIITHGHGDHFLGAKRLQNEYGCKACQGETDTSFMVSSMLMGSITETEYPHIDFYLEDGKEICFGSHRFIPVLTPGHTPGCMSLIFNCHDNGEEHWVSLWGGSGLPRPVDPLTDRMKNCCLYANSALQFKLICDQYNCDVVLGVHPHRCDLFEKLELRNANPDGPDPFIVGAEGVRNNLHTRASEALAAAKAMVDQM